MNSSFEKYFWFDEMVDFLELPHNYLTKKEFLIHSSHFAIKINNIEVVDELLKNPDLKSDALTSLMAVASHLHLSPSMALTLLTQETDVLKNMLDSVYYIFIRQDNCIFLWQEMDQKIQEGLMSDITSYTSVSLWEELAKVSKPGIQDHFVKKWDNFCQSLSEQDRTPFVNSYPWFKSNKEKRIIEKGVSNNLYFKPKLSKKM